MIFPVSRQLGTTARLMASGLERNLPLVEVLDLAPEAHPRGAFKRALGSVKASVSEGTPLPEALRRHPHCFPEEFCSLVEAGNSQNDLGPMLRQLENYYTLRHRFFQGWLWLALYMAAGVFLALYVVRIFSVATTAGFQQMFSEMKIELPMLTRFLFSFSEALPWVILGTLVAFLLLFFLAKVGGRFLFLSRIGYWIPLWGHLKRMRDLSFLCAGLALRLQQRSPLPDALEKAAKAAKNRYFRAAVFRVHQKVQDGQPLSAAMFYERAIPRTLTWAVSLGEERGDLPAVFRTFSEIYRNNMARSFDVLLMALTPLGIVTLGHLVGLVIAALFLPLVSLIQQFGMG